MLNLILQICISTTVILAVAFVIILTVACIRNAVESYREDPQQFMAITAIILGFLLGLTGAIAIIAGVQPWWVKGE